MAMRTLLGSRDGGQNANWAWTPLQDEQQRRRARCIMTAAEHARTLRPAGR